MGIAFYYHPDGYETARTNLMGRHAAGESFLKGICQHSPEDTLYCYASNRKHFEHFAGKIGAYSPRQRKCVWIDWPRWRELKDAGTLFMPGPALTDLAWQRRHGDTRAFSLLGVTHTTATSRVMDELGNALLAPLQPWDALVCTSQAVKNMVVRVVSNYASYLKDRFSMDKMPTFPMQLPIIPLGIDWNLLNPAADKKAELRKTWREKLKIGHDDIAALFLGRFSFHEKAHPMPMYLGLEKAAQRSGKRLHLMMVGWFENKQIAEQFLQGAKLACPSVNVIFIDGRKPDVKETIWFAADIFTSLSDNIQETFGLTPIEGMAAGLPVVVSDWDGYKETVRDGADGFRIPTCMPPAGFGSELALAHAMGIDNYGRYVGNQSQFTSVDVEAAAQAYERLATNDALRKELGAAACERAKAQYDWSVIIPMYESLSKTLAVIRKEAQEICERGAYVPPNPLRDDPCSIFVDYPTRSLSPETVVKAVNGVSKDKLKQLQGLAMNSFAKQLMYPQKELEELLESLGSSRQISVRQLCSEIPMAKGRALLFSLTWMAKMGLVELS